MMKIIVLFTKHWSKFIVSKHGKYQETVVQSEIEVKSLNGKILKFHIKFENG